MALVELTLLGGFAAQTPELHPIKISSPKHRALLAYLALTAGRRHAREKLVDLLWGDTDSEHGRNSLRQALTALRRALAGFDPLPIAIEGEVLWAVPDAIDVDVLAFERLAGAEDVEDLKRAVALYGGDLLADPGFEESTFSEWLGPQRVRLRELAIDALTRLIPGLAGPEAVAAAHGLVALDPLRESSHRILMALLAAQGQTEMALMQYRRYAEALERELGLKPTAAAEALYKEISAGPPIQQPVFADGSTAGNPAPKPAPRPAEKPLVAVMPFENRSTTADHQAFCDALADDISDAISRVTSFQVIARSATANFRGGSQDLAAIGRALGAAYVLHGSVHRLGERLRISAQLSDVGRDIHIWADQFDGTAGEIASLQDSIVRSIAASTETQIEIALRHAGGLSVQDIVARGNSLLYDETPEGFAQAMALGEQAVALDPKEPSAHLLRAEAFVYGLAARVVEIDADKIARGIELSRIALGLAPDQEWAHLALARAYVEAGRLDEAIAESERALELNPSVSNAIARLGECYALQGRSAEALEACRLAIRLNPRSPTNYWRKFSMALAHFAAEDDGAALLEAGSVARWQPDFLRAAALVAASATGLGLKAESDAALARCLVRYPDLRAGEVAPRLMPQFARPADRARLIERLRAAGLQG